MPVGSGCGPQPGARLASAPGAVTIVFVMTQRQPGSVGASGTMPGAAAAEAEVRVGDGLTLGVGEALTVELGEAAVDTAGVTFAGEVLTVELGVIVATDDKVGVAFAGVALTVELGVIVATVDKDGVAFAGVALTAELGKIVMAGEEVGERDGDTVEELETNAVTVAFVAFCGDLVGEGDGVAAGVTELDEVAVAFGVAEVALTPGDHVGDAVAVRELETDAVAVAFVAFCGDLVGEGVSESVGVADAAAVAAAVAVADATVHWLPVGATPASELAARKGPKLGDVKSTAPAAVPLRTTMVHCPVKTPAAPVPSATVVVEPPPGAATMALP